MIALKWNVINAIQRHLVLKMNETYKLNAVSYVCIPPIDPENSRVIKI